jgi:adenylate kinase
MRLVVIGAPGAGKGTQAKLLAKRFSVPHVSTGDLLRERIEISSNGISAQCKELMEQGSLVPDEIVIDLIREYVDGRAFIFDGFPRTIAQAQVLREMLAERGAPLHRVIYVTIPDEVIVGRMAGRQSCASCGAIYNVLHNPPKVSGICDACGGGLYVRHDDCEQVVRRRLRNYYALTEPIIEYYRRSGLVFEISGLGAIDEITETIADNLA